MGIGRSDEGKQARDEKIFEGPITRLCPFIFGWSIKEGATVYMGNSWRDWKQTFERDTPGDGQRKPTQVIGNSFHKRPSWDTEGGGGGRMRLS